MTCRSLNVFPLQSTMHFQPRAPSRLGTRRDQRRLVMMVGMLILVFWGIFKSSQPKTWEWLTGPERPRAPQTTPEQAAAIEKMQQAATERFMQGSTLPPDAFRSAAPETTVPAEAQQAKSPTQLSSTTSPTAPPSLVIPASLLATITDQQLYLRAAEMTAYWTMLSTVGSTRQEELEAASLKNITYAQIFSDPEFYRGRLVTLQGELVQLQPLPKQPNEFGVEQRYEGWLRNADSGKSPFVFHCLEIPRGLRLGDRLEEHVRITGYFFKRYHYAAKSGSTYSAPMFLAKRVGWIPRLQRAEPSPQGVAWLLGGLTTVGVLISGMLWWFISQSHKRAGARVKKFLAPEMAWKAEQLEGVAEFSQTPTFPNPDEVDPAN